MRKYEELTKATAVLRSNVDRMEQCSREFPVMIQTCINYLTEYRSVAAATADREREAGFRYGDCNSRSYELSGPGSGAGGCTGKGDVGPAC